ncbi:MAG: CPBP family glutamic-type intramembrane protease [Candidatus Saccharicenans sp.]|uniref:CPBP family glutamic-type intramembrane protease n=1 Tax=Candidatus Saccharicenans sp. TaxID=2819258 RepID=UPI00404AA29E
MSRVLSFLKKHPVLSYYFLVFAISWGGILILIGGPGNIPGTKEQAEKLFIPALLVIFAGPFFSGILMNFLVDGWEGLRQLLWRLLQWRVKARWYAVAILTGPVLVAAVLFTLSIFDRAFLPGIVTTRDKIEPVLFGISWGLIGGGLLEETGWTGFAVPELRRRHSILSTGLIVGVLWGIWHFMIAFWASDYLGGSNSWLMFVAGFLAFYLIALPAFRVLLVLVFDSTGGNLPVIMLMHAFLSAGTLIFQPSAGGAVAFIWNSVLGVVLWIVVAIVAAKSRGLLLKKPGFKSDDIKK